MTFTDYQQQRDAQNTVQLNIIKYCWLLTDALRQNYIDHAIRGHYRAIKDTNQDVLYHETAADKLKAGICPIRYDIISGKKYHKIVFVDGGGQRSAHAFVDKKTGEVYKSASWKQPAKGVRYDLRLMKDRDYLFVHADWSGGYLYAR